MAPTPTPVFEQARRRFLRGRVARFAATFLVPAAAAAIVVAFAYAWFSSSGGPVTGTVTIGSLSAPQLDTTGASFTSSDIVPGHSETQSTTVTVSGAIDTSVGVYVANLSGPLPSDLQLTVVKDHTTTIYTGSVAGFNHAPSPLNLTGTGAGGLWVPGEQHTFDFSVSLPIGTGNGAQGTSGSFNFVWIRELA